MIGFFYRFSSVCICLGFGFCLIASKTQASASDLPKLVPATEALDERFDPRPDVSLTPDPLVGVTAGSIETAFDLENVTLALPQGSPGTVCVTVRTRDGHYLAQNPYQLDSEVHPGSATLSPLTQHFVEELRSYGREGIAILARIADETDCRKPSGPVLAEIAHGGEFINIFVDSDSMDVFATIESGAVSQPLACDRFRDGARVTYDYHCQGKMEQSSPTMQLLLRLELDNGFNSFKQEYSIVLYAAEVR